MDNDLLAKGLEKRKGPPGAEYVGKVFENADAFRLAFQAAGAAG